MSGLDVTLILTCGSRQIRLLPPDYNERQLKHSYQSEFEEIAAEFRTHPSKLQWKKGKIQDVVIPGVLVVGVTPGTDSPQQLVGTVEAIQDMGLPVRGRNYLEVVHIAIVANGRMWYSKRGFLTGFEVTWGGPTAENGMPCSAKLDMTFSLTYVKGNSSQNAPDDALPKRGFSFSKG